MSFKTIDVDGVDVIVEIYNDNGVIVTTASVVNETEKTALDLNDMVNAVEAEKVVEFQRLFRERAITRDMNLPFYSNFSNYVTNNTDSNCNVGHSGKWYGDHSGYVYHAGVDSIQVGAVYSGPGNANKIVLSQTISCFGAGLTIDSSGMLSIASGSSSVSWTSAEYENTSYVSINATGYINAGGLFEAAITVSSTSEIQVSNSQGYRTTVSNTYANH